MEPFEIHIPDAEVADLRARLIATRWPLGEHDDLPGIPGRTVRALADRWARTFDWRARERELNRLPQVLVDLEGQRIHAVSVRSARRDAVPLVLLHGWPSTFAEFARVVETLAEPADASAPAFHVVVPSLPGYGFSTPLSGGGWDATRMAGAVSALMRALGHERYVAHGGDVGLEVATALGRGRPDELVGLHLNLGGIRLTAENLHSAASEGPQAAAVAAYHQYDSDGSAYARVHSTRPFTLAYGLSDSPVGQLTWAAEKFLDWSDRATPVSADDILTAVSLYWFTRTAGTAARFYRESFGRWQSEVTRVDVPTAVAAFPAEIVAPVREWAQRRYRIVQWTDMPAGGHFPALERPDLFVDSLRTFAAARPRRAVAAS